MIKPEEIKRNQSQTWLKFIWWSKKKERKYRFLFMLKSKANADKLT